MKVETFAFEPDSNSWSTNPLPDLDSPRTLVIAFGAAELQNQQSLFSSLRRRFKQACVVGCSTAGEIFGADVRTGSVSVAVLKFSRAAVSSATAVVREPSQSRSAGQSLASDLAQRGKLAAVLFLGDGVHVDQSELAAGFAETLGPDIPVFGVFAGDGDRFERPWVLAGDRLQSGLCVGVGLFGDSVVFVPSATTDWGSRPPTEATVTKSKDNLILEFDGKRAIDVTGSTTGLRPFLLEKDERALHFTPIWADDESGAVAYHRRVPEGSPVFLLDPDADSLIRGAADVARTVHEPAMETDGAVVLAASSLGRRLFLGDRVGDEVMALATRLPEATPMVGLYGYGGVISNGAGRPSVANSSLNIIMLGEREGTLTTAELLPSSDSSTSGGPSPSSNNMASMIEFDGDFQSDSTSGTGSILSSSRSVAENFGDLKARVYQASRLTILVLTGSMNESFEGERLAEYLRGRVVMDLAGIEQISSFGVRGWLEMMGKAAPNLSELYLAGCGEVVVNQMLMVRNFTGGGRILSFGAPYICTSCSNSFEFLHTDAVMEEMESLQEVPDVACPECGSRAVFDDDPESYFEFLQNQPHVEVPDDVREVLAERRLASMSDVEESIQKQIEGHRTTFRINKELDEKIRWQRVLQGVEGEVRIDFSRSRTATDTGIERMLVGLRKVNDTVTRIVLDQAHLATVEHLVTAEPINGLQVRSIATPAACSNCGVVRVSSLTPAQIRDAKRHGTQPETECRRCSASIPVVVPAPVVNYFLGSSGAAAAKGGPLGISPQLWLLIAGLVVVFVTFAVILVAK